MKTNLLPIGTVVYAFLDSPFRIVKGKIIGHCDSPIFNYLCEYSDKITKQPYKEHQFSVYLTKQEAKEAHERIVSIFLSAGAAK